MSIVKDIWHGRDNEFVLLLEAVDADGVRVPANMEVVLSALLEFEDSTALNIERNDSEAPVNWWANDLDDGEMRFSLGQASVDIEEGHYPLRLTLFSVSHPEGIVWTSFARNEFSASVHETGIVGLVPRDGGVEALFITDNLGDPLTDDEGNPLEA